METPTSTGTATQPEPLKPWKQVAEESNIFSLPPEQRLAEYDKWSSRVVEQGIRNGDFDSRETFDQFKLKDIRTRKNLVSDDIIGPSDDEVVADYNSFAKSFQDTRRAFAADKPTPQDEAIQGEVLQGKRNAAFVRGQMVFNPAVVNDPQKYREAILESDAPADIKMFYAGLRPEMEKSATVTRRRELASNVITSDVADKVVTAIQEGTELFGMDIGTPQSPALTKNKDGVWSVVDPEYVDQSASMLDIANARYNPLGDSQYKPLPAINEYQKKYGLTDEQVQQDYMESLIENAPTTVNRWLSKAASIEDYVKQLDSTVRVKNKDVAPEVRVQDPNLFFDEQGYNAAVDKASAPDEAKNLAKAARTQFADAVAGDIYNNLLNNRDDFRENYAKDVVSRGDMEKAITRYYKDKKNQAWYDDVGETFGQAGTALSQGGMNLVMMPSAILGMFGSVKDAEDVRIATMVQNGEMQAEEAVANRTGGAGFIKLNNDVMRIIPDLAVQMGLAVGTGWALSGTQAAVLSARTGIGKAAAKAAIQQAAITGEKAALKSQLLRIIPEVTANTVDDIAEEVLKASARTASNNPFKGGIGAQRAVGSAYAGLTSAASTFGQVYTDVVKMGKSPEEAIATARTAGVVAGAITSGLTHSFGMLGRGGVEDFASMGRKAGEFTIRDIVNAGLLDSLTTQEGRQLMRNIAKGISKDALNEGAEEGLDQALNLISQYATNPSPEAQNRKATDIINESLYASLLGGIAGGGVASVGQARTTTPGITAQQMQAEIIGAQEPVAPDITPPIPAAPVAPVIQPSADPAVQEAKATVESLAEIPDTTQTAAALAALANAAAVPKPEFNLPEIEVPAEPAPEVQPEEGIVTPEALAPEAEAPVNAEETPVEPALTVAKVELEPTENMKTPARDATKPEQMTPEGYKGKARSEYLEGVKNGERLSVYVRGMTEDMLNTQEIEDMRKDAEAAKGELSSLIRAYRHGKTQGRINRKAPVFIEAVDAYGITLPSGYVKQGELYVYQPEQQPKPSKPDAVQKPKPDAGVLRQEGQEVGLSEVDQGGRGAKQEGAGQEGEVKKTKRDKSVYAQQAPGEDGAMPKKSTLKSWRFTWAAADMDIELPGVGNDIDEARRSVGAPFSADAKKLPDVIVWDDAGSIHIGIINRALAKKEPVSSEAIDLYEIKLPNGYVKDGDLYVYEQSPEAKPELTPEQQDVVVFIEQEDEVQEEKQKIKKRITPGKARKVGIAKQIERLGINSNDPDSVIAALEKIAAKPPQKHHARIAKDLLAVLKGSGVQIQLVSGNDARLSEGDSRVNGWYDPKTNTAYINLDGPHELGIEETILHELVHASGEKVIQNPQTEAQKRILGGLEKQMLAARKNAIALGQAKMGVDVTDLNMLIDMAASQNDYGLFDILYGVSSLSEYHAHATTSRSFQKFLAAYKEGGKRSLLERFVNSITSLLSGKKTAENSDAEKAYATLLDLMREGKGEVRKSNTDTVQSRARGASTERDVEYMTAAESGDNLKARAALDEVAKEAGIYKGISARVSAWVRDDVSEETMTARATDPETEDRVSFEDVVTDLSSMSDDDAALEYVRWLQDLPNKNEMAEAVISDIAFAARIPATITRNANGEIIPLSQRFQTAPQSRARGVSSEMDAEYLELAKDPEKNAEALRQMVDEAAKAASGQLVFHGGDIEGDVIDVNRRERGAKSERRAGTFYASSNPDTAKTYPGKQQRLFFFLQNPFRIGTPEMRPAGWTGETAVRAGDKVISKKTSLSIGEAVDRAKQFGYDGVIYDNIIDTGRLASPYKKQPIGSTYVAFNSNQIKSADPVTRDDAGNIIPLSQRFQPTSTDIRYSRARGTEQDSIFVELERRFKAGDKSAEEEARKLIEKIAKEQGWTEKAYHGTPGGGFTVFDIYGSRYGLMGQGAYFTNAKDVAQSYADNKGRKVDSDSQTPQVYEVFLKPGRVLDMEAPVDKQFWLNAFGDYLTEDSLSEAKTNEDAFRAMEEGLAYEGLLMSEGAEIVTDGLMSSFDSVTHIGGRRIGKGENLHNVTIVFSSEQIKSADPFTYDDNGNLILPSERFQPESPDIRFSRARGIVSDTVTKYAPEFNVVDDKDGPSVFFDGRNVTVNPSKLDGLDEYEVKDLAERAVVAAKAASKDPIAAGIIQQTDMYDPYNFDSVSRKEIRKSLAKAHAVATENGMAPLAMDLGVKLFEYGGATDAEVRKSMARGTASDEEYLAAVEAGDMEKVQAMVDAAAKEAGYEKRWNFSEKIGIDPNRGAFYTTSSKSAADSWGEGRVGETRAVFISSKSPAIEGKNILSSSFMSPELAGKLKAAGFDSASGGRDWKRGDEIAVFSPSQIKSADPVTRDDAGNVIPLSQRFQSESPDIRYSKARGTELVTYIPRTYSAPRLLLNKLIAGFRSRGMVTEAAYEKFRDSEGFKKANASFISFIANDYAKVANKYFGEGEESWLDFRVFSRDAAGEVTVSKKGFKTPQEAESFAKVSGSKDYIVATGQDLINKALGSNSHTLKEDVRDKIEKLTKKGLDDIANSIKAYKEEYLNYWNLVMLETQADMVDPNQIATLKERKQQWMKALELREAEQRKIVDDARKEAVRAALADGTNRIIAQQEFAKTYLPDDLVYQIGRARGKIDELSNRLRGIKWLMDGSELEMIIGERLEVYVTRSYEAFETKDRVGYVNWLNEAYQALYEPGKAYDPLAMDRIMPLVRHIKETIIQRRIEDLVRENEQNQIADIMAELIADPRQITQVERIPGQPIEGTEYEQLVRAVAKKELETRRSQEKKDFIERAITSLGRNGFASNIGDARKRKVALRKEANRLYEQRYPEQTAVSAIMGAPNPLRWAMMTETEAHDIANVERSLSESPGNINGSTIWTSSINGLKYSSFMAAVNDDFQKNLDFITGAPTSKTGLTGATANDWKRLGDKILEHKNDVPAFLRTFLGEKDNPLLRVSDTIMKQSHLVAVGELYQNLAKVGKDEGWLVGAQVKNSDAKYNDWKPILNSENTDQGYGSNPFKEMYADPVMIGAINTLLAANQPSNTATKVISRIVGLSLWAVTAGSVKAIVRNLSSLGAFLLNSGILSAVLVPSRTIPVLKNVVLAARIMNESMTAVGKVSGGKKIEGKAFQLADKFWTGTLAAIAAQRPATAIIKGASTMAQFASRMKENPSSEQAQEMYQLAVKLGVANDNVQKESIQRLLDIEETISRKPVDRNLGKFAKALKLNGIAGFGSYLLGTIKTAGQQRSQLYGAPDDFTKILAWLNEMDAQARIHSKDKAEYNKWRGKDGLFTDMPEEHVRRAASYTTDLIQSHSKVWAHITQFKKAGFGTFIAPFIAARAEFYRNTVNAYRIAFAEMRSDIPLEKANGWMRFASALMAHLAYGTMASAVLKMIFRAFADDEEAVEDSPEIRDAIRRLGPEYAKNKIAASVLYKNGTFDWIDISFSTPFAFVWESVYAGRRAASDADVDDFVAWNVARDVLGENLGNFVSPQIAVGAGATVISGFDPVRGIKIWDSQADNTAEKVKKATLYYLKQAGLPGDWKSAMNIYNAAKGVEENGRKYKVGTEIAGVFLGASVRTIKVTDMVRQKLSQAKDNLNARITPFYNAQLGDSNIYGPEDFVDAAEKYHKTGQEAIKRMQRVVSAGRVLLAPAPDGEKMLRNVMNSDDVKMNVTVERAIMSGKSIPSTLSPQTRQKVGALGKKHDDDRLPITEDTLKRLNQKP